MKPPKKLMQIKIVKKKIIIKKIIKKLKKTKNQNLNCNYKNQTSVTQKQVYKEQIIRK